MNYDLLVKIRRYMRLNVCPSCLKYLTSIGKKCIFSDNGDEHYCYENMVNNGQLDDEFHIFY